MKKQTEILLLVTVVACFALFSGCKKDKDEDQPEVKHYRMKTMSYTDDGDFYNSTLTYNANNKLLKISESQNGIEFYRNDWDWDGNQVVIRDSYLGDNGIWENDEAYQVITYTNDQVSRSEYILNDSMYYTTNYTWNAKLLTKELQEYFMNDVKFWEVIVDYIYENNLLTTVNYTSAGILTQKKVIEYENGRPSKVKVYDNGNILQESSEVLYSGDKVSQINSFKIVQGTEGDIDCTETRTYDNLGNLNTLSNICDGDQTSSTIQITNEEGIGNLNDLILTNVGWLSVYLFPDVYPSGLVSKKKKK